MDLQRLIKAAMKEIHQMEMAFHLDLPPPHHRENRLNPSRFTSLRGLVPTLHGLRNPAVKTGVL